MARASGGAKQTGSSRGGGGKSKSGDGAGRQARGGLAKPVRPSNELAAVVGQGEMTRAEVTKRVWDYIKQNNLQDQQNKRMINADNKLRPIFGGKNQVSMFEMTKLVNQHLQPT